MITTSNKADIQREHRINTLLRAMLHTESPIVRRALYVRFREEIMASSSEQVRKMSLGSRLS